MANQTHAIAKVVFDMEDDLTPAEIQVKAIGTVIDALEHEGHYVHLACLARWSHTDLAGHVDGLRRQWRALWEMTHDDRTVGGAAHSATITEARLAGEMARAGDDELLAPALRSVVDEFGIKVVSEFLACGIRKPKRIRHLVSVVRSAEGGRP